MNRIFVDGYKEAILSLLVQNESFLKEIIPILNPSYFDNQLYIVACESIFKIYRITGTLASRAGLLNDMVNELIKINKVKDKGLEEPLAVQPAQQLIERIFKPIDGPLEDVKVAFVEYCRTKEMQGAIVSIYNQLSTGEMDHNRVMGEIRNTYLKCNSVKDKGISFFEEIDGLAGDLLAMRTKLYTTGITGIDKCMDGGLTPGTLTTIIGAAKGGKSMFLVNSAVTNCARGYNVVVFTLEISDKKWRNRVVSRISGVPLKELQQKSEFAIKQVQQFKKLHAGTIVIKSYPSATVDTLRGYLYYLEGLTGRKADVVVVDYGDLLRASSKVTEERFIQRDAYTELRALASEFDCAVITASQCNRQGTDKATIRMSDIAEAFSKVQISDHILTICMTEEERLQSQLRLFFAGSREAETGKYVPMRFDWSKCFLKEKEPNDDKAPF